MTGNTLQELKARRAICQACIRVLDQEAAGDPEQPDAIEEYKRQLAEIDRQITELTGKPPDIVIGLQAAELFARSDQ